jgi:hypothetical protein
VNSREKVTKAFLWLAVLVGGPLVGAKLFDLLVLAGAWNAHLPGSLAMNALWHGLAGRYRRVLHPVLRRDADRGVRRFDRGAGRGRGAIAGCSASPRGILALLVLTVVAFWPMNAALFYHGIGSPKDTITDAGSIRLARLWVRLDWLRVAGATAAFVAALRALTLPWPAEVVAKDPPIVRGLLALALAAVAGFIVWFVSNI